MILKNKYHIKIVYIKMISDGDGNLQIKSISSMYSVFNLINSVLNIQSPNFSYSLYLTRITKLPIAVVPVTLWGL